MGSRTPPSPADTRAWDIIAIELMMMKYTDFTYLVRRVREGGRAVPAWTDFEDIFGINTKDRANVGIYKPHAIALLDACGRLGDELEIQT